MNSLIPEPIGGVQFRKGPYYADEGDFSTAGAASINYVNALERPLLRLTGGNRFKRMLAGVAPAGVGASPVCRRDGERRRPVGKPRGLPPAQWRPALQPRECRAGLAVTFMGYDAKWTATDQVPARAVGSGIVPRFGTLDASDGGTTHRYTLSAEVGRSWHRECDEILGFAMDYGLDLFSNFTYLLTIL